MADSLHDIFTRALSARSLFKDKAVLRAEYIPQRLPFRDREVNTLGEILAPLLHGSATSNILLYGKTGTGKTAVVKHVLRRLSETASAANISVSLAYSNTRMAGTEYRVVSDLGAALDLKIPFTGLALGEAIDRVFSRMSDGKSRVVLVLDEVDFLVKHFGDNTLYDLTRAGERILDGSITLLGISNDLKFKEFLDPRVLSSLNEEEVVFAPYTAEQLKAILEERATSAFVEGSVSSAALSLCAALAGSEHGDARRALDLLRVSGEVAEREGAGTIREDHVRIALRNIEQDRVVDALTSLPLHEKLVLIATILSAERNSTGEVYDQYLSVCRTLACEPLTQRRVSTLLTELDLLGLVSVKVVSQGRYGRTKRVNSLVPVSLVRETLRGDPVVGPVLH